MRTQEDELPCGEELAAWRNLPTADRLLVCPGCEGVNLGIGAVRTRWGPEEDQRIFPDELIDITAGGNLPLFPELGGFEGHQVALLVLCAACPDDYWIVYSLHKDYTCVNACKATKKGSADSHIR